MLSLRLAGPITLFAICTLIGANAFAVQAGVAAGVTGKATIEGNDRPGPQIIKSGGEILTNDTLSTSANARMQALLVDETALTLGPNSSLTIDKFVYDPNKGSGEMVANMVRGSLRFVSGRSSALGKPQFKIKTPVGVMGIRGTSTIIVEREQGQSFFMGLVGPGPDNNVGLPPSKIEFANEYGSQTVDKAGVGFFVEVNQPPGDLIPVPAEISNLFVNKSPETTENQEGEGGEETAENQEGEGGEETAENQEGEGGEQTAENQEGEGGEQTAENQEGEGGEQTAQNQEGEGGQGGESTAANGEGGPPAEGGDGPVATNEGGDGASEGPAGSDNTVVASASDNEPGETGPVGGAGNDAAAAPAEAPVAGGPDNGAGADVAPAPAPAPAPALAPAPAPALAPAPAPEMPVFAAINVEEAAGPGVDIAISIPLGFGPPGAVGPGVTGPNDDLPVDNLTQIINDDVQSVEDTVSRFSGTDLNINAGAFIEFDWTASNLIDVDGFLFGTDSRATTNPFLIIGDEGSNTSHPTIRLDTNCIVARCSEVIIIDSFPNTGLYGVGMHLDPDSNGNTTGDIANNSSSLLIRVNQGGTLQRTSRGGSEVTGGVTLREFAPPPTGAGDTWFAAEINPVSGEIRSINQILDVENDIIQITGFEELTRIANLVETEILDIQTATINDISLGFHVEFDWKNSSLIDLDGFLFGEDTNSEPFLISASSQNSIHPEINLDQDCFNANCSEVISIGSLASTGLYGVGIYHAGANGSETAIVDNRNNISINFIQGGTLQRTSAGGSEVSGGTTLLTLRPPENGSGNAWLAAKIDPATAQIKSINQMFDAEAGSITFDSQEELQSIAREIDNELVKATVELDSATQAVQEAVSQALDVTLRTFIEFDWSRSSLVDLDAHLNGPDGSGGTFHVFFSDRGDLAVEGARLENDCTGSCKTEVITIGAFNSGAGQYTASLFNFTERSSASSTSFVDNRSDIIMKINQGGTLQRAANGGFKIINGTLIKQLSPPTEGFGNTWRAVTIDASSGSVDVVNEITHFDSSSEVSGGL